MGLHFTNRIVCVTFVKQDSDLVISDQFRKIDLCSQTGLFVLHKKNHIPAKKPECGFKNIFQFPPLALSRSGSKGIFSAIR